MNIKFCIILAQSKERKFPLGYLKVRKQIEITKGDRKKLQDRLKTVIGINLRGTFSTRVEKDNPHFEKKR